MALVIKIISSGAPCVMSIYENAKFPQRTVADNYKLIQDLRWMDFNPVEYFCIEIFLEEV